MAAPHSPIGSRRRLGSELRRLRNSAGLTLDDVAERMTCSPSKISRLETGKGVPKVPDVRELMRIYGVAGGPGEEELLRLVHDGREHGWWEPLADGVHAERFVLDGPGRFAALETDATIVRAFAMSSVPGLLQTADYGRAVTTSFLRHHSAEEIDRLAALLGKRQEALRQPDAPLGLVALIDEGVLRRTVAESEVMIGQLAHLSAMAGRDNVSIRILPFAAGVLPVHNGDFVILEIPAALGSDIVFIESHAGNSYLDGKAEVRHYREVHAQGLRAALTETESQALLADCLAAYRAAPIQ